MGYPVELLTSLQTLDVIKFASQLHDKERPFDVVEQAGHEHQVLEVGVRRSLDELVHATNASEQNHALKFSNRGRSHENELRILS